jgi:hypothetical protein
MALRLEPKAAVGPIDRCDSALLHPRQRRARGVSLRVLDALAHRERLAERALRMLTLAERFKSETPRVGSIGLAPGVLAVGGGGEVEGLTGGGERLASVGPSEVDRRPGNEQFDLPQPVAAEARLAHAVVGLGTRAL